MIASIEPPTHLRFQHGEFPLATKKVPAAKSSRSKASKSATAKKSTKKAPPKKGSSKAKTASSGRPTNKKNKKEQAKPSKKVKKELLQEDPQDPSNFTGKAGDQLVTVDRRRPELQSGEAGKKGQPKLERRKKVQRRRQIDPTTCERDYSLEEVEFMNALDDYKRKSGRMFPTCSEILEVIRTMGYVKISSTELVAHQESQETQGFQDLSEDTGDQTDSDGFPHSESISEFGDESGLEKQEQEFQWTC